MIKVNGTCATNRPNRACNLYSLVAWLFLRFVYGQRVLELLGFASFGFEEATDDIEKWKYCYFCSTERWCTVYAFSSLLSLFYAQFSCFPPSTEWIRFVPFHQKGVFFFFFNPFTFSFGASRMPHQVCNPHCIESPVLAVIAKVCLNRRVYVLQFLLSVHFLQWLYGKPTTHSHIVRYIREFGLTEFILTGVCCIWTCGLLHLP